MRLGGNDESTLVWNWDNGPQGSDAGAEAGPELEEVGVVHIAVGVEVEVRQEARLPRRPPERDAELEEVGVVHVLVAVGVAEEPMQGSRVVPRRHAADL